MLRALLLDAFEVELRHIGPGPSSEFEVDLLGRIARFAYVGHTVEASWNCIIDRAAVTAMRFLVEAAMEHDRLA